MVVATRPLSRDTPNDIIVGVVMAASEVRQPAVKVGVVYLEWVWSTQEAL